MRKRIGILYRENKFKIRVAATIIAIVAALLFFGVNGEKDNSIKTEKESQEIVTGDLSNLANESVRKEEKKIIVCDISGQVENPGVYEMAKNSRLGDLIESAGGLSEGADIDAINRAATLNDGEKIYVPKIGEQYAGTHVSQSAATSKVNINSADNESLCSLKGIGPAMAERIITYRTQNGGFSDIEELKNVSGIGQKTFDKIKEHITI